MGETSVGKIEAKPSHRLPSFKALLKYDEDITEREKIEYSSMILVD